MFLSLGLSVNTRLVRVSPVLPYVSIMRLLLNYRYSSRVPEYLCVDWSHCSPERSCDISTCTIFSVLFFGPKVDTVFLHKLHFALHVFHSLLKYQNSTQKTAKYYENSNVSSPPNAIIKIYPHFRKFSRLYFNSNFYLP